MSKIPNSRLNVKIIAFDLDDTLLNHELKITEKTVLAIQECARRGIYIVLCSGRTENGILPFVRQLDIAGTEAGRYIIGINGASVLDLHQRISIYSNKVDPEILKFVHKEASLRGFGVNVPSPDTIFADVDTPWTRLDSKLCSLNFKVIQDFDKFLEQGYPKILVPAEAEKIAEFLPELKEKLKGKAEVFLSKPFFLEVMSLNCGKGQTLLWLAEKLGIKKEETMAFGDSLNDESMIRLVQYGVAMLNGRQEIKDLADFVTEKSNEEDGIGDFLNKWVL